MALNDTPVFDPEARFRVGSAHADGKRARRTRVLPVLALVVTAMVARGGGAGAVPTGSEISPDGFTSARVCGECHTDIYNSWKKSLHSLALTDPIFDTAYMQAVKEGGEAARRVCLSCHAPMTTVNGDYLLEQGVTREGVSCDFCHTVTAVHLDRRERPYSVEPGLTKRSVLKVADSMAHEIAYSELHGTAEFCGGCHNYTTARGAMVLSTYEEWRRGPYASEGVPCQDCHMQVSRGNVVRPDVKQGGDQIHLHRLIHDRAQLRSALNVVVTRAVRTGDDLRVEVEVENVGSGHMIPTGIPSREVVLTVTVEGRTYNRTQERRYRKVVADERGRPLSGDVAMLLHGARILNDNRIHPREKRLEHFTFGLPRDSQVKVTAKLTYYYAPLILKEQPMSIELGQAARYAD